MNGPMTVAIDAEYMGAAFMQYENGILDNSGCPTGDECCGQVDHAVTLVGWGVRASDNMEYWIVKNSWTMAWGENGYFRVENTGTNTPGMICINSMPGQPLTAVI